MSLFQHFVSVPNGAIITHLLSAHPHSFLCCFCINSSSQPEDRGHPHPAHVSNVCVCLCFPVDDPDVQRLPHVSRSHATKVSS